LRPLPLVTLDRLSVDEQNFAVPLRGETLLLDRLVDGRA
jgi:hypothetical protein